MTYKMCLSWRARLRPLPASRPLAEMPDLDVPIQIGLAAEGRWGGDSGLVFAVTFRFCLNQKMVLLSELGVFAVQDWPLL